MEETRILGAANIAGAGNGAVVGAARVENPRRTLMEYAQPLIDGIASCIRKPAIQANNFVLKSSLLT